MDKEINQHSYFARDMASVGVGDERRAIVGMIVLENRHEAPGGEIVLCDEFTQDRNTFTSQRGMVQSNNVVGRHDRIDRYFDRPVRPA